MSLTSPLNFTTTFNSIGIELFYTGDSAGTAQVSLQFKKSSEPDQPWNPTSGGWRQGLPLWPDHTSVISAPPPFAFHGSVLQADAGTSYDIKLTITNPNGVTAPTSISSTNTNLTATNLTPQIQQVDANTVVISLLASSGGGVVTRAETAQTSTSYYDSNGNLLSSVHPNFYVSTTGSDSNSGTSLSSAFATLQKAVSNAPSGSIILVEPGTYAGATISTPNLTILAQYSALDNNRNQINTSQKTIIENVIITPPSPNCTNTTLGTVDSGTNIGCWQQQTFTGPYTNQPYTVWMLNSKFAGNSSTSISDCYFASDLTSLPDMIPVWYDDHYYQNGSSTPETPARWAEKVYINPKFNYGCWADPSTLYTGETVYMRTWNDVNPNNGYVYLFTTRTLDLETSNTYLGGLEVRGPGPYIDYPASGTIIDHDLFDSYNDYGIAFNANRSTTTVSSTGFTSGTGYANDVLIQNSAFLGSRQWSIDTNNPAISWDWVEGALGSPVWNGTQTTWYDNDMETEGQEAAQDPIGGHLGKRLIVRNNTFDQYWYQIQSYCTQNCDIYIGQDLEEYNNLMQHSPNNSPGAVSEPTINWRLWNNRMNYSGTNFSGNNSGFWYGPVYFFRNQLWETGTKGCGKSCDGMQGTFFKYSVDDPVQGYIYVINNTFWTDDETVNSQGLQQSTSGSCPCATGSSTGLSPIDGKTVGSGYVSEGFYLRNNILRSTNLAWYVPGNASMNYGSYSLSGLSYSEDYNWFYSTNNTSSGGIEYNGLHYMTFANYISALSNQDGVHDDLVSGNQISGPASQDVSLTNPAGGDLSLASNSPQIDAGTPVPNIADLPGVNYFGAAPDLGAIEMGSSITPTPTPTVTPSPTSSPTPNPSACPTKTGDFNSDGSVNLTDLSIFAASYGTTSPSIPNPCTDMNSDGSVNLTDLSLFAAVYGT